MFEILEVMMSSDPDEVKQEKLGHLLKEKVTKLGEDGKRIVGAQIAMDRLDGLLEAVRICDDDTVFHSAMKTVLTYMLAGLTRNTGIDEDLLKEGRGEEFLDDCYAFLQEQVEGHIRAIQEKHDRLELN